MNDTISRQAAIEAVGDVHPLDYNGQAILERIKALPSAQPEIIKCKDCIHRDAGNGICEGRGWPMQLVPDDGFCDKGKRSEDE